MNSHLIPIDSHQECTGFPLVADHLGLSRDKGITMMLNAQGCQSGTMALKLAPGKIYERQVGNYRHQRSEEAVQKIAQFSCM